MLSGGGARAAYQVGFLRYLGSRYPDLCPGILTGVSAGGIIATLLAARPGSFLAAVDDLSTIWRRLQMADVFRVDASDLLSRAMGWSVRLMSGGGSRSSGVRSLVDTEPLHRLVVRTVDPDAEGHIPGIARNLDAGRLDAVALTASSYTTGQSVTWVQSRLSRNLASWSGPRGRSVSCALRVEHVMSSASLPLFFPAIEVDGSWYGDGGIRLTAPLSPAVHLGARRIMVVSTRYPRSVAETELPVVSAYPPPAQVAGVLFNAVFLDLIDADVLRLQQVNQLLEQLPDASRGRLRHVDLLVLRPSMDLGRLANEFEPDLPRGFRFMVRGLGSHETRSNDLLSLLMFQPDYIGRLIDLGESDARARAADIDAFIRGPMAT